MSKRNANKIILDLCGGSGAWSKPYKDAGYDVRVITLPDQDVRTWSVIQYPNRKVLTFTASPMDRVHLTADMPIDRIHGILAAPPCTEFSFAKTTAPRNFRKGMETVEACMQIIWEVQKEWWYGNNRSKATDLWGKYKKPVRTVRKAPKDLATTTNGVRKRDGVRLKNKNAEWYANASAAERAVTPEGFARAFFKANP